MQEEFKSQKIKAVIKDLLKKKDITYEDLAEQLECSVPTIKRILGPEELTLNRLLQLCEIVDVDLAELEAMTKEDHAKEEAFTPAQEEFLAKNKNYFAYLMSLFSGETPKQIADKHGLSQRSTDKYLIGLEKHDLVRVTGKQKVKPNFKNIPRLGSGVLGKVYYDSFIRKTGEFFVDLVTEGYRRKFDETKEKAMRNFEKLASFEEKTKDPSELMTAVVIQANTIVKNDYEGLVLLETIMGDITNI